MDEDLSGVETIGNDVTVSVAELGFGDLFAGRYRIERCLGRGSMGTVYAAHDSVVDEIIALKLLAMAEDQSLEAFGREVRLARRVTHRNTARTFDLGLHEGIHFITMELVDGESLRVTMVRRGRLSAPEVMELGRQLALGLQAAHDVGVIHRDLKPANVLLAGDGRAVITDFGVASTTAEEEAGTNARARMAGTPMYMAPEQVEGSPIGPKVDLYALGLVLYEALTGTPPFRGNNRVEIAMSRLSRPPPDPRKVVPVPDALADLIVRCLARSAGERPASLGDVAHELAAQLASLSDPADPAGPIPESTGTGSELLRITATAEHALAVMPFRYRGPADDSYLAEVLTDELVDLLAMTRGLRVSASGATTQFKQERDARTVGRALGVDVIIDGTVMRSPDRVRIVARLIDVNTGFQRSTERFEGRLEDVFDLQDRMAKRVAESLRVELSVLGPGNRASAEAVELYLRGRKRAREPDLTGRGLEDAIERYDQALRHAPDFALALAARAEATVLRWFLPARDVDWGVRAQAAVDAALAGANHLADTHLAAARLQVNHGDISTAARHLAAALEIAPTCAAAHEYLGLLQCDAGRSRQGVRHIELAHELDLSLFHGAFSVLRYHAMRGDRATWHERLARMQLSSRFPSFVLCLFDFRLSLWDGDVKRAGAVRWRIEPDPDSATSGFAAVLRDSLDHDHTPESLHDRFSEVIGAQLNPRLRTGWCQIMTEVLAWRGAIDLALEELTRANTIGVLLDADWFESCPLLEPLRSDRRFSEIHEQVQQRVEAIWRLAE